MILNPLGNIFDTDKFPCKALIVHLISGLITAEKAFLN